MTAGQGPSQARLAALRHRARLPRHLGPSAPRLRRDALALLRRSARCARCADARAPPAAPRSSRRGAGRARADGGRCARMRAPYRLRCDCGPAHRRSTLRWRITRRERRDQQASSRRRRSAAHRSLEATAKRYCEVALRLARPACGLSPTHAHGRRGCDRCRHGLVIVGPQRCYLPPALQAGGRRAGAPRSSSTACARTRNWGIGDFTDLARGRRAYGARKVRASSGVNPLHALYPHDPRTRAPTAHRAAVPERALHRRRGCAGRSPNARGRGLMCMHRRSRRSSRRCARHRSSTTPASAALKLPVLEIALRALLATHAQRQRDARGRAFARSSRASGERLRLPRAVRGAAGALPSARSRRLGLACVARGLSPSGAPAVRAIREGARRAHRVLRVPAVAGRAAARDAAADCAARVGYGVGLYTGPRDLDRPRRRGELGEPGALCALGASVGAPPDDFNLKGQDWGLPPLRPEPPARRGATRPSSRRCARTCATRARCASTT